MTFPHAMLRDLKANWNSYGAPPIDERCIEKAFALWRQLHGEWQVVPCNDGGVQLEQHRDGFDIEITVSPASSPETKEAPFAWFSDAGDGTVNFTTLRTKASRDTAWVPLYRHAPPPEAGHLSFVALHILDELENHESDFTRQEIAAHFRNELTRLGLTKGGKQP